MNPTHTVITTPPIDYRKDFLKDPDAVFQTLWNELDWVDVAGPRLEYHCNDFNVPYIYGEGRGQRKYEAQPYHPLIQEVRKQIEAITGETYEVCFLNGYRNGSDQLGWHADDSPEMNDERHIAIVSVGARREIYFRPQGDENKMDVTKQWLDNGSLCLMKPGMQDTHYHRIPKSSLMNCGPRISFTYRGLVKV